MSHNMLHVKSNVTFFGIEDSGRMADKGTMKNWLEPYLKNAGLSQEELADRIGKSRATINRIANGRTQMTRKVAEMLAPHLKVSVEELVLLGDMPENEVAVAPTDNGIPNLDIHAGLGNGGMGHIEVDPDTMRPLPQYTDGDWNMPPAFMSRFGNIKGVFAFVVTGDSMTPTIKGGSAVFVDTKQNYPSPPGLFVIDTGDGRLVKRVELIPRSEDIRIISDNKEYSTYEFNREDVHIFGRVIAVFSWNE